VPYTRREPVREPEQRFRSGHSICEPSTRFHANSQIVHPHIIPQASKPPHLRPRTETRESQETASRYSSRVDSHTVALTSASVLRELSQQGETAPERASCSQSRTPPRGFPTSRITSPICFADQSAERVRPRGAREGAWNTATDTGRGGERPLRARVGSQHGTPRAAANPAPRRSPAASTGRTAGHADHRRGCERTRNLRVILQGTGASGLARRLRWAAAQARQSRRARPLGTAPRSSPLPITRLLTWRLSRRRVAATGASRGCAATCAATSALRITLPWPLLRRAHSGVGNSFAGKTPGTTEGEGFEPSNDETAGNGFRDRQPTALVGLPFVRTVVPAQKVQSNLRADPERLARRTPPRSLERRAQPTVFVTSSLATSWRLGDTIRAAVCKRQTLTSGFASSPRGIALARTPLWR
jgi:hypothetical protein